ncbi:MAG TPA: cysteine--tRNA ligase [Solirubrobacteraceae bacterium]|jgi:cysteinyl-tRNA synthetase|nr:cysteine--tRNA ligase [Solirubrobacteraceae bacterium]
MREIRLHDTRSGELLPLRPREPARVGIYACGPTVYSRIHIGNARPFVVFSLLKRFLEHEGLLATLVINVTDINDKIYTAARAQGRPSAELAAEMGALYRADTDALGLGRPDHEPLATETMGAIVAYIDTLIARGHAYAQEGDVFFSVRSDPAYGELSHRRLQDMDQGEDVEGSQRKRDPLDFALWKARKDDEDTSWDPADFLAGAPGAPEWGPGRPGWHIECSAMAESLLGVGFDVHGGGSDLVFPHHENEAAQTRAARGAELARIWMHNGMIQFTGEKMAKSVGNIALLHEVIAQYGAEAVVMYLVSGHYRQPLAFSAEVLAQAQANVRRIREVARRLGAGATAPRDPAEREQLDSWRLGFLDALANDYNTPLALAQLNEWMRAASQLGATGDDDLREMLHLLGLDSLLAPDAQAPEEVRELAEQRQRARAERDFAAADRLRDEISARGWEIRDGAAGPELVPLSR